MAIKPIPTTTLATTFTTGSYMLRGAITSGSVATISNINRYKQNKISKNKAIRNSVKSAIQGGIASTTAVATLQQYGEKNGLGMLTAIAVGVAGVYAVEKLSDKIEDSLESDTNLLEDNSQENNQEKIEE
jgi:hypothetical protein